VSPRKARIRVYVAEDHPMVLQAVERLLRERPEFDVVGKAANGRDALEELRELRPDVALVDVNMPGLSGLDVLHAVKRDELDVRVILLTGSIDNEGIYRALAMGARGVLSKTARGKEVCEAIDAIARGEVRISEEFQVGLSDEIQKRSDLDAPVLSAREAEVLRLTADGCSAAEIGQRLNVAVPTVRTHLANLYEKLGVSSAPAAVAEGMRRQMLE
jgi:two-component system nitrate/nitrite response regulator NarL